MSLGVSELNGIKVYNLSAGKTLPQFLEDAKKTKTSLRYNDDFRRRIELIQDFEFPTSSGRVKTSPDGQYVAATGTYAPQIRLYETSQLSMKFSRNFDCEVVQFQFLSDDFRKLVFLLADRTVEFHAQFGKYYRTRIPKFGRDMTYHSNSCDLYIAGSSDEIWRVNLDQGRYMQPLQSKSPGINCCVLNPAVDMLAFGGEDGRVECWDPRSKDNVGSISVVQSLAKHLAGETTLPEVSAIGFDSDGLLMGVGTSTGHILLYDVRYPAPLLVKDHQYGLPIKNITFHPSTKHVLSADSKIVKVWDKVQGRPFTNVEAQADINDICLVGDSGLILVAQEQPRVGSFFVPALGPAPKWCSFLDNITEELEEEKQTSVYDDYKFVTRDELQQLGCAHLIGTNLLRAYMHGFFMDMRLYNRVKSVAEPFAYETYRKSKIQQKLEEQRANRITIKKKLPKVNKDLAQQLNSSDQTSKSVKSSGKLLEDSRFGALFENPDFQIDEQSDYYKLINPNKQLAKKFEKVSDDEQEEEAQEEDEEENGAEDSSSSEDEKNKKVYDEEEPPAAVTSKRKGPSQDSIIQRKATVYDKASKKRKLGFYELKAGEHNPLEGVKSAKNRKLTHLSLADRLKEEGSQVNRGNRLFGAKEMSYVPQEFKERRQKQREELAAHNQRKRRNVSSIGVKETAHNHGDGAGENGRGRGRGRGRGGRGGRGGFQRDHNAPRKQY